MKRLSLFLVTLAVALSVSVIGLPAVSDAAASKPVSKKKCVSGGGTVDTSGAAAVCKGGTYDGRLIRAKKI
jgi:hypothetical protein